MRYTLTTIALALGLAAFRVGAAPVESQPVIVLRVPDGGIQPQAVVDMRGTLHLIYYKGGPEGGDVFYVKQAAGQTGFSSPIQVNTQPRSATAMGSIRGAQLALGRGDRIHVVWNGHIPKGRTYLEAPMFYTRLNDSGAAFEPERNVITKAGGLDGGGSVAADQQGNVYVMWHAPKPGADGKEDDGAVFVAKSTDDGKAFAPETMANPESTGACGCCGMKAFVDANGNVLAFYRAARILTGRNEVLLVSSDHGATFRTAYSHGWKSSVCPMSSFFLSQGPTGDLAAAETHDRIYYVRLNPASLEVSNPVSLEARGKYPVAVSDSQGRVLLAWAGGTAWGKGGVVVWQMFDQSGRPISNPGKADGLSPWSFPAAVIQRDGNFAVIY